MDLEAHATLSIPDHAQGFVLMGESGAVYARFVYDKGHRLIMRASEPDEQALFGYGASWLEFRDETDMPMPWHWTRREFHEDLADWLAGAPAALRKRLEQLYPEGKPDVVDAVFIPELADDAAQRQSHDQLRRVLEAALDPNVRRAKATKAIARLAEMGVVRLPPLDLYDPRYQQPVSGEIEPGSPVRELSPGYGYDGLVIRRASVEIVEEDDGATDD